MELAEISPAMMAVVEDTPRSIEIAVQFFQRAADAFARGVFARAQGISDFRQRFVFKEPQQHGLPVFFAERGQGFIQQRRHLIPDFTGAAD